MQGLSLLWLTDLSVAQSVLLAFLPLSRHSVPMRERLLVLLRKELYGTDSRRRRLAVAGVCGLLRCGALCDEDEVDVVVALRPLLSADPSVADAVYSALSDLIAWHTRASTARLRQSEACDGGGDRPCNSAGVADGEGLGQEAMGLIAQMVMARFSRLVDPAARGCAPAAGKEGAQAAAAARRAAALKERRGRTLAGMADPDPLLGDGGGGAAGGARAAGVRLERCFETASLDGKTQARVAPRAHRPRAVFAPPPHGVEGGALRQPSTYRHHKHMSQPIAG
jgi:hypothetical protein